MKWLCYKCLTANEEGNAVCFKCAEPKATLANSAPRKTNLHHGAMLTLVMKKALSILHSRWKCLSVRRWWRSLQTIDGVHPLLPDEFLPELEEICKGFNLVISPLQTLSANCDNHYIIMVYGVVSSLSLDMEYGIASSLFHRTVVCLTRTRADTSFATSRKDLFCPVRIDEHGELKTNGLFWIKNRRALQKTIQPNRP